MCRALISRETQKSGLLLRFLGHFSIGLKQCKKIQICLTIFLDGPMVYGVSRDILDFPGGRAAASVKELAEDESK